eukprot:CCRYP_012259-RA/>CCRYP_012259-RA protein AED:0.02 eAED:0.02 QI:156/1/1/1/0/0/2/469/661
MTTATAPRTTTLLLLPPLLVLTSALLTPMQTATLQCRPCIVPNHPSWQPHPHPQRHQTRQTSSHIKTTTSLHQQKQLLQPQKGGIVVESPPNGVIVRDILVDMILGPRDDKDGSDGREDDDFLLGGGTAAFSSSRSRATSPPPSSLTMRMQPSSPPPSSSQDKTLPLFPNLKTSNTVHGGPRRISPGESAVFERAITAKSNPRSHANGKRGGAASVSGASSWNTPMDDIRRQQQQPGGVSIRGDSSMLRSTGFVGGSSTAGGGSTRFFSSNTSGAGGGGGATSFRGSSGVSLNNGNGYNSVGGGSSRNNVGKNNNNNQSFRNGTGRDYSSSAGTKFGSIGRSNSGGGKNNVDVPLGGASRSGVSIKGDSSMFSSTGFMNGGDVVRNSGGGGGYGGGYGASPPVGNRRASVTSTTAYNSQHYFDAPAKSSAYPDTTPSYNTNEGQSISTGGYDIHSYSSTATPPDTPSYYNLEQQPSFSAESRNVHTTPSPTTKKYTSGQSLGDNFLSASHSVKRSHDPDDDDEFDEDMLGYESPTRRGEGFLTAPDPSYADQPIHYGKWISELYAEQGLDVLSGGMEGFGVVMGEMRKGGDFGGRNAAAPGGGGGGGGYGNGSSMGYGGDAGYGNGNNNGYGGDVGYGSSNSNGGGDVSFSGFRGTPPQGY